SSRDCGTVGGCRSVDRSGGGCQEGPPCVLATCRAHRRRRPAMTPRLTPPELARALRVDVHTVLAWIRDGQLRAVNVGAGKRRPRWRIDPADVAVFEAAR